MAAFFSDTENSGSGFLYSLKRAPQRFCLTFEVLFDFIPQEFYGFSVRSYARAGKSAAG